MKEDIFFKKGLDSDLKKEYNDAVSYYSLSIQNSEYQQNAYINLAFLNWIAATEFAWADLHNINKEIRRKGVENSSKIITAAIDNFNSAETNFWRLYFEYRLIGEPILEKAIIDILDVFSNSTSVPYFYLYLLDKLKYMRKRDLLLEECYATPTAKNLYIISLIK